MLWEMENNWLVERTQTSEAVAKVLVESEQQPETPWGVSVDRSESGNKHERKMAGRILLALAFQSSEAW